MGGMVRTWNREVKSLMAYLFHRMDMPQNEFYENPHLAMRKPTHCGGLMYTMVDCGFIGRLIFGASMAGLSHANRRDPSRTASE